MNVCRLILFFVSTILFQNVIGATGLLEATQNLTIANNLSHNGVTCIFEDSKGYIWIGTYDGLNRYDGYEFKTYKNTVEKTLLNSNRVRTINEDPKGNLWIGTDEGISIFVQAQNKFKNIYSNINSSKRFNGPIVREILFNDLTHHIFCITEGEGILEFDPNYKFLNQTIPPWSFTNQPIKFNNSVELDSQNYLFSSSLGMISFNIMTAEFKHVLPDIINQSQSVIKVKEGLLFSAAQDGLSIIEYTGNKNEFSFKQTGHKLQDLSIKSINIDSYNKLWIGTMQEGIILIDDLISFQENSDFNTFQYNPRQGRLRSSCIAFTSTSGCWVGTFNKGIFRFNTKDNPFFRSLPEFKLRSNSLVGLCPLGDDKFYFATGRSNLKLIDTDKNTSESIPVQLTPAQKRRVSTVFLDSKENLWLRFSRNTRLYRVMAGTNSPKPITFKNGKPVDIGVEKTIREDRYHNIWIKTNTDIVKISFDDQNDVKHVESLRENPFFQNKQWPIFRDIYPDPKFDFIWIGSDKDGLYKIKMRNQPALKDADISHFVHEPGNPASLPSNFITTILRVNQGKLWLGTEGGGICQMTGQKDSLSFITYSEKDGLSNNVVKSIQVDDHNNLWIATNIGLNKFEISKKQFRIFREEDGLPFEDFTYLSTKLNNGTLVFAGVTDYCFFKPDEVLAGESLPPVVFNELRILNHSIHSGDTVNGRVILFRHLNDQKKIVLKHNENIFSLDLTALHYANPENHFIQYQLLPINDEWVEVPSNQRTINYSGLQPGEYRLRVKASNSLNEWTKPKTLRITIKPPFWLTLPAIFIYLIIVTLIISSIWRYMKKMNALRHSLEIEQLEKDQVKAVNEAKLRFFSNISHEIKTPLTLISSPIDSMLELYKGNNELRNKLQIVRRQSKKISRLVDQVHDFQRADANKLKMEITVFNFNAFINELISDFSFIANKDSKHLRVKEKHQDIYVSADKDKLEKIFNNILTNAFKYTKPEDTIEIEYFKDGKQLLVNVSDTGRGIHSDDLPHIFERFFQSSQKGHEYTGGSGIGLAFSKRLVEMHYGNIHAKSFLGEGTSLHVQLPIVTHVPDEDQRRKEENILSGEMEYDSGNIPAKVDPSKIKVEGEFRDASIFFVEDNSEMRTYVSETLSYFFRVKSYENGKECTLALKDEWPDIVVSDVLMPEMNGFELCKSIKSNIKTSHLPVILLTACTAIEDEIKGLEVGADAYIKKPFNIQHLVTRIETLLLTRKKLRERFKIDYPLKREMNKNENDLSFLERMYTLMEENLDNTDFDIDKCARQLYLNRTLLYQKVKAITNQTPFEMIKLYRLKRAAEMLAENKLSVNEVYAMTGFKSRSNFSKLFKERYSCTPGNYATEALKKIEGD